MYKFSIGQPWPLFKHIFVQKTIDFSGIKNWMIVVEEEYAYH